MRKRLENFGGVRKKGILLLPDLIISQEKGTFLKLSDKHGLQYVAWSGHTGGTGRPTTFEFSDLEVGQLCSQNNYQCCSFGLSSLRPTEAIL